MASEKQVAANRRNAARSSGPKSTAGRQVVRLNALKHGLQAEHVVIPGEDPEKFEALRRGLGEQYQPVGSVEHGLVQRIACCTWRLRRANVSETAIMRREHFELNRRRAVAELERAIRKMEGIKILLQPDPDDDDWADDESNEGETLSAHMAEDLRKDYAIAQEAVAHAENALDRAEEELKNSAFSVDQVFWASQHKLEKLSRYETAIERQLRNAMQDLERVQSARKREAADMATVIDVTDLNREDS
jgi:hypothetical protein